MRIDEATRAIVVRRQQDSTVFCIGVWRPDAAGVPSLSTCFSMSLLLTSNLLPPWAESSYAIVAGYKSNCLTSPPAEPDSKISDPWMYTA